jgi:hypothetical protein
MLKLLDSQDMFEEMKAIRISTHCLQYDVENGLVTLSMMIMMMKRRHEQAEK